MNNTTPANPADNFEVLGGDDESHRPVQGTHEAPEFGALTGDGLFPVVDNVGDPTQDPNLIAQLNQEAEARSISTLQGLESAREIANPTYSWQTRIEAQEGAITRHPGVQGELTHRQEQLTPQEVQYYQIVAACGPHVTSRRYGTLESDFRADAPPKILHAESQPVDPNLN